MNAQYQQKSTGILKKNELSITLILITYQNCFSKYDGAANSSFDMMFYKLNKHSYNKMTPYFIKY